MELDQARPNEKLTCRRFPPGASIWALPRAAKLRRSLHVAGCGFALPWQEIADIRCPANASVRARRVTPVPWPLTVPPCPCLGHPEALAACYAAA